MAFIKTQHSQSVHQEERRRTRECGDLLEELSHADPTARRWAARDLMACPGSVAKLLERLKIEPLLSVREVILTTLIHQADPAAVSGLVDCLRSDDAALRNEAVEAMQRLPDDVAPIMHRLLHDGDPDVRIFAINVLESLRHPRVEAWLIEVISTDAHLNVCATALDLLAEVGTSAVQAPLQRLKARFADEPYIQFAADLALRRIHES